MTVDISSSLSFVTLKQLAVEHLEVLHDRTQRKRREIGQRSHDNDRSDQQDHEQRPIRRQRAAGYRDQFLCGQAAGDRQTPE